MKCRYCNTAFIPTEANFCPNCGMQLVPGEWKTIDVSKYPSLCKQEISNSKTFFIQNDTHEMLSCNIDGVKFKQIFPNTRSSIQINQTTTLVVSCGNTSKTIRLYNNDVFVNIIFYMVGQYLQYRTN